MWPNNIVSAARWDFLFCSQDSSLSSWVFLPLYPKHVRGLCREKRLVGFLASWTTKAKKRASGTRATKAQPRRCTAACVQVSSVLEKACVLRADISSRLWCAARRDVTTHNPAPSQTRLRGLAQPLTAQVIMIILIMMMMMTTTTTMILDYQETHLLWEQFLW